MHKQNRLRCSWTKRRSGTPSGEKSGPETLTLHLDNTKLNMQNNHAALPVATAKMSVAAYIFMKF